MRPKGIPVRHFKCQTCGKACYPQWMLGGDVRWWLHSVMPDEDGHHNVVPIDTDTEPSIVCVVPGTIGDRVVSTGCVPPEHVDPCPFAKALAMART